MAAAAEAAADQVLLTSDNPRSESPEAIVAAMVQGLRHPQSVQIQLDRALAIGEAVVQAAAQDVVLVAGKGHESEQEIMGVRHPFSDVVQARRALQQRAAQHQGGARMKAPVSMQLNLSLALSWLSQARGVNVQGVVADRVHTDSRSLQAGDLFVALRG